MKYLTSEAQHVLAHLREWMKPVPVSTPTLLAPSEVRVRFDPLGVGLILGTWNYPVMLTLSPLSAAISGGNAAAEHDLGAASACLTLEATARGLFVHQMIGILPDRARELYQIPDGYRPLTGLAIGYLGNLNHLPQKYQERDLAPRQRKPLAEFVFGGRWGTTSDLMR